MRNLYFIHAVTCIILLIGIPSSVVAQLDLNNLRDYANQAIPDHITKDNTPMNNPIADEGATLGRVLFYDKLLSVDNTISCASCHQQEHAFSDLNPRSSGIGGNLTDRHSTRLINTRFGDEVKFRWDETASSLEAQMTLPIRNEVEMGYSGENGQPSFSNLIQEMAATDYYPAMFNFVFGDATITEERMQLALAQFVRSIQSFDAKYDIGRAQVNSDLEDFPNFTVQENNGKQLFIEDYEWVEDEVTVPAGTFPAARRISGGFNCATCHRPPEFDIDPASLNNGFVFAPAGAALDVSVFRSPTLRDLIKTDGTTLNGGMFHAGLTRNLDGIFVHYNFRPLEPENPFFDPRLTRQGLSQWLDVTVQERQSVFAFLRTLTGNDVYTNGKWSDPFDANGNLDLVFQLGDVSRDGSVDFLDISPFIQLLSSGEYQLEADTNPDTQVNFLDIGPFIQALAGQP